jgi:hypothetical protein
MLYLGGQRGYFQKLGVGGYVEGLQDMFEGDSADMCGGKFPLMLMGGRAEGLACAEPGARTPNRREWNLSKYNCQNIIVSIC